MKYDDELLVAASDLGCYFDFDPFLSEDPTNVLSSKRQKTDCPLLEFGSRADDGGASPFTETVDVAGRPVVVVFDDDEGSSLSLLTVNSAFNGRILNDEGHPLMLAAPPPIFPNMTLDIIQYHFTRKEPLARKISGSDLSLSGRQSFAQTPPPGLSVDPSTVVSPVELGGASSAPTPKDSSNGTLVTVPRLTEKEKFTQGVANNDEVHQATKGDDVDTKTHSIPSPVSSGVKPLGVPPPLVCLNTGKGVEANRAILSTVKPVEPSALHTLLCRLANNAEKDSLDPAELCHELTDILKRDPDAVGRSERVSHAKRVFNWKLGRFETKVCPAAYKDPLHLALSFPDTPRTVIQALLEVAGVCTVPSPSGDGTVSALTIPDGAERETPLHVLLRTRSQDFKLLNQFLEICPKAVFHQDRRGNTALHIACQYGAPLETIRLLTSMNPKASAQLNMNGHAPLQVAQRKLSSYGGGASDSAVNFLLGLSLRYGYPLSK